MPHLGRHIIGIAILLSMEAHASSVLCDDAKQNLSYYYKEITHIPKANTSIFRGKLIDVYPDSAVIVYRIGGHKPPMFYRFQVLESWAPSFEAQVYITALTYIDDSLPLQPGKEYLVATKDKEHGDFLRLSKCDLLKPVEKASTELALLGLGTAPTAQTTAFRLHPHKEFYMVEKIKPSSHSWSLWFSVGLNVLLGGWLAFSRLWRSRK